MKLEATPEGAAALREFAEAMPLAIENIRVSTEDLFGIYQSVAENVGPHEQDFRQMLATVKKAQEEASDSIQKPDWLGCVRRYYCKKWDCNRAVLRQ